LTAPAALQPLLLRLTQGAELTEDEAEQLFEAIVAGTAFQPRSARR
jgi:anthranilate phosphoribosyltransferase